MTRHGSTYEAEGISKRMQVWLDATLHEHSKKRQKPSLQDKHLRTLRRKKH